MSFSPLTPAVVPTPLTPGGPSVFSQIVQFLSGISNPATVTGPFLVLTGVNVYYGVAAKVDAAFIGVQALLTFFVAKYLISSSSDAPAQSTVDLIKASALLTTVAYALYSLYRYSRA
jgi:hypothetical protein